MYKKIKIGVIGARFGSDFQFHIHPNSTVEAVSDLSCQGRRHLQKIYNCSKAYNSIEELLKDKEIDAVFIATPATLHEDHVIKALNAGKHVLSAIPVALNLEGCFNILESVKKTGLKYMLAETSYYRQSTISARNLYQQGAFGKIFNTIAEYSHPGLGEYFFKDGQPTWRHGLPPMYYPTHCTSFLVGVTKERLVSVSCLGWGDEDPILKNNPYNNHFWNEVALFKTDNNTSLNVSINWKGALKKVERASWIGERMSYSYNNDINKAIIIRQTDKKSIDDGNIANHQNMIEEHDQVLWWKTDLLPEALRMDSRHGGSHSFITHEFIDAILNDREPEINIYEALSYTVPGIIAHESALKDGETLKIPIF